MLEFRTELGKVLRICFFLFDFISSSELWFSCLLWVVPGGEPSAPSRSGVASPLVWDALQLNPLGLERKVCSGACCHHSPSRISILMVATLLVTEALLLPPNILDTVKLKTQCWNKRTVYNAKGKQRASWEVFLELSVGAQRCLLKSLESPLFLFIVSSCSSVWNALQVLSITRSPRFRCFSPLGSFAMTLDLLFSYERSEILLDLKFQLGSPEDKQ